MTSLNAPLNVQTIADTAAAIHRDIATVIEGKSEQIDMAIMVLFAGGHLLVEDVPGVGKTMLANALGASIDAPVKRIQFTPDLLPSDITGVSIWNQHTSTFEFSPGGIFASIVVGDEINRASPKTQSALLEAMAERTVSVDGVTHPLPRPFMVVATQNPIEMEGTYPLPEAQRDRFWARIQMGYPTKAAERAMLASHGTSNPLAAVRPVTDAATVAGIVESIGQVHLSEAMEEYIVDVVSATRTSAHLSLGASPRASLQLLRLARVRAAMDRRDYVIPDDIQALASPVLAHRVITTAHAKLAGVSASEAISQAVDSVAVPRGRA